MKQMNKKLITFLTLAFFTVITFLLYQSLSRIKWDDFLNALKSLSPQIILLCFTLVLANFLVLTGFDYLGIRYFKIPYMTYPKTVASAFCCYVFNLNLGALVGGVGMRLRIYTGWGVPARSVSYIVLFSSLTNWLGHTTLLAVTFLIKAEDIQELIPFPLYVFKAYGVFTLVLVLTYFILCLRSYVLNIKGITFPFPKLRLALLQLLVSMLQWGIIGLIIFILISSLGGQVTFGQILFTTLIASIAGVFTHIPAGLGVLETIFLRMNLPIEDAELLASILAYRALYYLIPLLIAVPLYLGLESAQKNPD